MKTENWCKLIPQNIFTYFKFDYVFCSSLKRVRASDGSFTIHTTSSTLQVNFLHSEIIIDFQLQMVAFTRHN